MLNVGHGSDALREGREPSGQTASQTFAAAGPLNENRHAPRHAFEESCLALANPSARAFAWMRQNQRPPSDENKFCRCRRCNCSRRTHRRRAHQKLATQRNATGPSPPARNGDLRCLSSHKERPRARCSILQPGAPTCLRASPTSFSASVPATRGDPRTSNQARSWSASPYSGRQAETRSRGRRPPSPSPRPA